jgi:hypothetical protein
MAIKIYGRYSGSGIISMIDDGYKSVRLPEAFVNRARKSAQVNDRSMSKQIQRWCQIGAAAEINPDMRAGKIVESYNARPDAIK